ncbi:helix-turn-helix domain-containing protein [Mucilaginibacter sp. X4EP1]|uniref:helix-turn-helix domain-containing protein n=1 Tax=Mucilaginibacter sp. X4EP1 TaxID=2723092 RepID=UPI00216799DC|nr:AraC family transcriptional regulator [Mucilaginibacter sp. X4EP1]MCS3813422.1 AraC-like DNA-binding protein [Mucilaginibacter sp. X4EP1]
MTDTNLLSTIAVIAVFVSLILAFFLLTVKTQHKLSNVLLAVFITLNAVDLSSWFVNGFLQSWPGILLFKESASLLTNPVFFLYALSVCYSDFKLRPAHLLHALPFVLINLELLPRFYSLSFGAQTALLNKVNGLPELFWMLICGHVQFVVYVTGIFLVLHKYRRIYLENYTDPSTITYRWLFQLTLIITVIHFIVTVKDLLQFSGSIAIFNQAQLIVGINAVFILCWFVFKALYNPDLFRGIDSSIKPIGSTAILLPAGDSTAMAPLSPEQVAKIETLKAYMLRDTPYLSPSLTIQELAGQMHLPVRELSLLINYRLGQHFFDFVNEYRVEKAMKLLRETTNRELTIQQILYEVGFNSKSSFNTAFKKHAGVTPKDYRNNS